MEARGYVASPHLYRFFGRTLTAGAQDRSDGRHTRTRQAPAAYRGEVWTDGRGRAVVVLPADARHLQAPLDYVLEPADVSVVAAVAAELSDGRFTIVTDEPHVKVAWRVGCRAPRADSGHERGENDAQDHPRETGPTDPRQEEIRR